MHHIILAVSLFDCQYNKNRGDKAWLLDYQFCQTSVTSFEMLAEIGESAEPVRVTGEILRQVRKLLADKNLEEIQFSVRFVGQITPNQHTGKNR